MNRGTAPRADGAASARLAPIPILMYHQVFPEAPPHLRKYVVHPRAFAAQMGWLALSGYRPVDIDAMLEARAGRATLPRRPVVITFDDGFQGCFDHAVPVLRARGYTAIFYLVAGLMGESSRWLAPLGGGDLPLMSWSSAQRLVEAGFRCGAHSQSHPHLAQLGAPQCRDELVQSRRILEDRLGLPVEHLAYPYGSFDARVRTLAAEAGYRSACSVQIALSPPDDDPLALHRVPVNGGDTLLDFVCRLRTAHTAGETLWAAAARGRRRLRLVPRGRVT